MLNWSWVRRRWWDFRFGHSTYLAFALSFINFIVINYSMLSLFQKIFPNLLLFGVSFIATYIPLATFIGYKWHRRQQLSTDIELQTLQNPFLYKAQPGKEIMLNLPLQRLLITLNMKLWQKFDVLTQKEERQLLVYLQTIDKLIQGEVLAR